MARGVFKLTLGDASHLAISVAISPNYQTIVSGATDNTVR